MLSMTLAALESLISAKVVHVVQIGKVHIELELRVRRLLDIAHPGVLLLGKVFVYVRHGARRI